MLNLNSKKIASAVMAAVIGISVAGTSMVAEAAPGPGGHGGPAISRNHHPAPHRPAPHHPAPRGPHGPRGPHHHYDSSSGDALIGGIIGGIIGGLIGSSS